jgi:hypothetical protein
MTTAAFFLNASCHEQLQNRKNGARMPPPVFFQTTSVALVVETAQQAKMTNTSVTAAVEKLREAIAITICNLPLL